MQNNSVLPPNRPRRITRAFDLKMIDYYQTSLSNKQGQRAPPVLLQMVGQGPGQPNKSYTPGTAPGLLSITHREHASCRRFHAHAPY